MSCPIRTPANIRNSEYVQASLGELRWELLSLASEESKLTRTTVPVLNYRNILQVK